MEHCTATHCAGCGHIFIYKTEFSGRKYDVCGGFYCNKCLTLHRQNNTIHPIESN